MTLNTPLITGSCRLEDKGPSRGAVKFEYGFVSLQPAHPSHFPRDIPSQEGSSWSARHRLLQATLQTRGDADLTPPPRELQKIDS